jgi:uncharacterized coiled-coil DUF342 family protein
MRGAALSALISGVFATNSSPVGKVLQLLDELKGKIDADLAAEGELMEEYTSYCDDESTKRGFAIQTATKSIEGYSAFIEQSTGAITDLSANIEKDGQESAAKSGELAEGTSVREEEHTDFLAAEKELVDTVDTLSRAIVIIKRSLSFAQGKGMTSKQLQEKLGGLATALNTIIEAADISSAKKQEVQSLMQEEDEFSQPQATSSNYESKSGSIVDTLNDMKDKAEGSLQDLRKDETKARHAFELIKQSLNDAVTNLGKQIEEAQSEKSTAEELKAKAEGDLSSTSASKAADEDFLANLNQECANKAQEWSERQRSATDELGALAKAKEILSGKFAFVQTAVKKTSLKSRDARDRLSELLRKMGRKYNSFGLMQMAGAAKSDPFEKIRGLINGMIDKLQKQAAEEATQEAFCKEETKKSNAKRDATSARVDKVQSRIDSANATVAELQGEISELREELAEIDSSQAAATKLRSQENADFQKASKDFKESVDAVTQAMVVLKDFYRGEQTVSHGALALVQQPGFGSTRGDAGHSIIEILEVAESDFARLLAEAEASESEAADNYDKATQENKVAKATKEAAVKGKNSEIKQLTTALANHKEDLDGSSKELDAILEYIEKLKPQCENKAMTYEERKQHREDEIKGLKNALEILDAEGGSAGFLQKY